MEVRYGPYPWYFLWSLVLGVALAILYDLLRLSRRIIKTNDIIVNIEDIIFLIISGAMAVVAAYITNNGELRLYGLLGTVLGFIVYRAVLGWRAVDLLAAICRGLQKAAKFVFGIIISPVRLVIRLIGRPVIVTIGSVMSKVRKNKR